MPMNLELKETLITLERQLLDSGTRASKSQLDQLLSDDFLEIGRSGLRYNKKDIIAHLSDEVAAEFATKSFEARELAPNIIQLCYKSSKAEKGNRTFRYSLRSSIWKFDSQKWGMVFHQGTPCKSF